MRLVAGERRLRAAKMAGLKKVPCVVLDVDMEESSVLAMVENVQRQDLNFAEEARGIANLIRLTRALVFFDMSRRSAPAGWARARAPWPTSSGCCACRRTCSTARSPPGSPSGTPARCSATGRGRPAQGARLHNRKGPERGPDGRICGRPARPETGRGRAAPAGA